MKTVKFFAASLFLVAMMVSCSKDQMDKSLGMVTTLPVVEGTISVAGANNGGNISCEEVAKATGCTFDYSIKIDYSGGSGGTVGPIKWWTDGVWVTWESSVPLKIAVIVKGGPNANVYFSGCEACEISSGSMKLSAPVNPKNGKPYGLSNLTFCYSECRENPDFVVALKSYVMDKGQRSWVTTGSYITPYPLVLNATYPLYQENYHPIDPAKEIGSLRITDTDGDDYWEITVDNSKKTDVKFSEPYLFVGPLLDIPISYYDYPYPNPKVVLNPPVNTWTFELPFKMP